jgi:hypothetical protein
MGTPTLNDLLPASVKDLERISTKWKVLSFIIRKHEQKIQNRLKVWTESSRGIHNQNYTNKDNQENRGSTKMQKCVQKKLKDHSHVSEI